MPLSAKRRRELRAVEIAERPPKKFKRKRCRNCDALFPMTKPNREFCSDECRKQFHHFGCAFGPLEEKIRKMVRGFVMEEMARLKVSIPASQP